METQAQIISAIRDLLGSKFIELGKENLTEREKGEQEAYYAINRIFLEKIYLK